ncbi:hypothetical protein NYR74_02080 [Actinobacillus equuli subsp. haemolyticus]|nr:hypothetical protein [Actinobacillus equuli]WGE59788.1 hypothetical protein NYR73_03380 [Actinobacillus equuli subsp. haemolyticus]WGE61567.1 hypothetical protein NYR74_02080 [Actinobacillus equuli subsp. haemolyticus]
MKKLLAQWLCLGLSRQAQNEAEDVETQREQIDEKAPIVDSENNKIITTYTERQLFDYVVLILGESVELVAKDTESYFSILFQGKSNRWILRYFDNKQHPCINVPLELLDIHRAEIQRAGLDITGSNIIIDRPENILRISGLIRDCLVYCQNDENFARKK